MTDAMRRAERLGSGLGSLVRSDRRKPPMSGEGIVIAAGVALAAAVLAGTSSRRSAAAPARRRDPAGACADGLRRGSALLGASVLADSTFEHFRGNYDNRLMYVPPALAAATIAVGLNRNTPGRAQAGIFSAAALVGAAGLALHAYNILKRPGGLSWNNLFYAAPIAAPGALALSGVLGLSAQRVEAADGYPSRLRRLGRAMSLVLSGGLLATVSEVALLHFRGAYHNPAMYAPVVLPPLSAASLVAVAANPAPRTLWLSRVLLRATAAVGAIGTALHAYGVHRNMGGWRNWTQNLFSGPPLPAPPSFTGLALAGLGVLRLLKGGR